MRNQNRKLVYLLWSVIAVLVIGGAVGGYLFTHKLDELTQQNADLTSNVDSLREQLHEAKISPSPSASVTPSATPTPSTSATPTPTPIATPTPTKSPASH